MKHLIRRLSRVADSSPTEHRHHLLSSSSRRRRKPHAQPLSYSRAAAAAAVPAGHVPVYVGEEMERFVVSAELMNHPVFVGLLNRSAQEYGYAQKGVLHIPCHVIVFERVVDSLRLGLTGESTRDLQELAASFSGEDLSFFVPGATE
ncbi:PREDICTED: auxin-responsive protein SAUR41 isoform X2 [Tarenaya hassleriana]|uniref:auxin-responsive protein SAUR41 isoform X1 n=1 Tax=Tarenaya hassleriana TaxID=28532 RepID=UPI00053C0D55|nr:PREDICTED: auxin-responsive protein SAUR41 isoform X1 [Tarenaya hassleriana]XP_010537787.1 PREDICTED: auxin-responsive protein SAUR41 isoform X2 [Tarenaya hassleriana]